MEQKVNHYKYLEKHLNSFWKAIFNKTLNDSGCAGIITAHGDKCYSYKRKWERAGVPFPHGVAIYFLTYTKEMGDTPKSKSGQWVIDNYDKYKHLLPEIDSNDTDILSPF
tara:strand:- start:43941 stop:44270 length:330 start_codon:yes stop_codon:yes gene_type:complete